MNLATWVERNGRRLRHRPALAVGDRVHATWGELAATGAAVAGGLRQRLSLSPGARVAIVMRNRPEYLEAQLAAWHAGLVAVPVNARLHRDEIAYILDHSGTEVVVTDEEHAEDVGPLVDTVDTLRTVVVAPGPQWSRLTSADPMGLVDRSRDDPAWLFYTSGTTGRPKGVVLTHGNLMAMTLNYLADVDHASVGDHLLHAAPMSHGSGLYTVPNVAVGATQLIPASRAFDADEIRDVIAWTPNVKLFAAPTMVMRLVDAYGDDSEAVNLKSIIYGGGPMYVADSLRALDCFGPKLVQIYGQGEAPMTITVLPVGDHYDDHDGRRLERLGSVGRAQTGVELAVLDTLDRPVAAGEIGEVCVRGDVVMAGYLDNPEATATALANGWLHTGDLGRLDERGYLTLVDRSKDLIISGGSNIYPREVEEVLLLHPAIKEAAVIGVPDAQWGESVLAVVVKKEGHIPDEKELDLFCLEHIARFKRPKGYVFVDELPKNATGKVLKRELRERFRTP
jgi:long-chain acyl-CoA synthetase